MSISNDLFLAILALDSYNHGYNQGLKVDSTAIGNATIIDDTVNNSNYKSLGFYATVYSWNSKTVISYRGTDFNPASELAKDIGYGWTGALGNIVRGVSQTPIAIDFYTSVTGQSAYASNANVILTGHSLGGGLAATVAAMGGNKAVSFDHMPY
jgi:hypothetical protein